MSLQNQELQQFFDELIANLIQKYPNEIVSFVLFGSATTDEWIRGKSDIDCIVLIKNKRFSVEIEKFLNSLLLNLDKKYDLKLSETCTTYKKTSNLPLDLIIRTENKMMFGKPFYVVSQDQINFKEFKIRHDFKIELGTRTIASLGLFLQRIKDTGIVLYGKDIRKDIPNRVPGLEKFKSFFNAMLLLMMSFIIYPFGTKYAFAHAVKANFWACDDVLFVLDKPLSNTTQEVNQICSIFGKSEIDCRHLYQSLKYKKIKDSMVLNRKFVFEYILRSTKFVYCLYGRTILKSLRP